MDISALSASSLQMSGYVPLGGAVRPDASLLPSSAAPSGGFSRLLEQAANSESADSATASGAAANSEKTAPALSGRRPVVIDRQGKLYEQCEALETFLVKNLISGMRKTIQKSELIDTGFAGEVYEDMLYDEYTKDFVKGAKLGFADMAYLELTGQRGKMITR